MYLRSPMEKKTYISVILPLKLEWEPCYSVPENMDASAISVGDRVKVNFSNREYTGVVSGTDIVPQADPAKIRDINEIEMDTGRIFPQEIDLWRKISEYYLCSIGEVYKAAYPYGKINLEEARAAALRRVRQQREKLTASIQAKISKLSSRVERKKELLSKARKESTKTAYETDIENLERDIEAAKSALEQLHRRNESQSGATLPECGITLTEAQQKAYDGIQSGFRMKKPVMLHGVTGSGKTEIYMRLAYETLSKGRNVLYLVPEIALSRQLEDRLHEQFGETLMIFHSGESAAERRDTAERFRNSAGNSSNYILLGTRSSIFLPHHDLGLIIVDEEHDNSYKQDSPAPRYNGRDTALMLQLAHGCDTILGSATPSLEEVYNCMTGKHLLVELKHRFHGASDSDIEIIDTKAERRKNGMRGSLSVKLIERMKEALGLGGQILILRSRRAWAPVMQCASCGEIVRCPHCSVSLSYHKDSSMQCHYCGHKETYKGRCGKCGGDLTPLGAGTQKIEEELASLFPEASIARLDSDTAQNKAYEKQVIRDFGSGKTDILIGTQIITKGFDFGNLSMVAVIAADSLLGLQDFRADEKALQILEQFRGRSGRRGSKGLFVIQTSQPEHPIYKCIENGQTDTFSRSLMQERKDFLFPPFSRIIEITVKDRFEDRCVRMARKLADILGGVHKDGSGSMTGPYAPVVDKVADMHIRTIRISMKKDRNLAAGKAAIRKVVLEFERIQKYDGHIAINVDPS